MNGIADIFSEKVRFILVFFLFFLFCFYSLTKLRFMTM